VINHRARPAVCHYELEFREALQDLAGKARPLLSNGKDVVVCKLLGQPIWSDCLTKESDLDLITKRGPVTELFGTADVIV